MRKLVWSGLVLSGLLVGCASAPAKQDPAEPQVEQDAAASPDAEAADPSPGEEAKPAEALPILVRANPQPKDPINIEGARVDGNILTLNVSHGGGCAEHSYTLAWDGTFQQKSGAAPVANLVMIHDANGDRCKAMKFAELRYDLSTVSQTWAAQPGKDSGTVELALPGLSAPVSYSF
ncbi:hypothetical protein HUA76_15985 [Myxococcus sp. CA056]|uniref:hypothetical protein n=1 Tax=Myxococcus sp. CA056 TaxID=2741740 RepID=UPI00157AD065|nr:hypothetical protein [Myxococcus sp. CA056]NTX12298.1 hypothetical protein [Myxococcus sp. CA056]